MKEGRKYDPTLSLTSATSGPRHLPPLEHGGRTLHVFNLYGYDMGHAECCELNRNILDEMLPHVHALREEPYVVGGDWNYETDDFPITLARGNTLVRPPSDGRATSPYHTRKIDWFLISPHMRDSVSREATLDIKPNHHVVSLRIVGSWIPQSYVRTVILNVRPHWDEVLSKGDVDTAWALWNQTALAALGLNLGDRGPLKHKATSSPPVQRDATYVQDLSAKLHLLT
eukprot:3985345-Amphidinium_carterae.2